MSDLFKKNAPRLTEDEENRLWRRVRAIPEEVDAERASERGGASAAAGAAGGSRPWWRGLFAAPAFRYGAPALAVLVAATLFALRQNPHAPVPTASTRATSESSPDASAPDASTPSAPGAAAPALEPAPAPARERERAVVGRVVEGEQSDARRNATALDQPQESLEKKQESDRDVRHFAAEPPADARLKVAQPPAAAKESPTRVTVIKGGKQDDSRGGRSAETRVQVDGLKVAEEPAEKPAEKSAGKDATQKDVAQIDETGLGANEASGTESGAPKASPAPSTAPLAAGAPKSMYRADAASSSWGALVAGTSARKWIEVVPSLFDDGGVVVMAGSTESGLALLVDASAMAAAAPAPRLVHDVTSGRWSAAAWVYDRAPSTLSPQVVRADVASPKPETGFTVTRRASFRDAPDDVQIAYLAAEGERATAISASASGRARLDRLLVEANGVASRHPTDARVVRLVQLLSEARARVR